MVSRTFAPLVSALLLSWSARAQTLNSPVALNIAQPANAQACSSLTVSWSYNVNLNGTTYNTTTMLAALNLTYVDIWAQNVPSMASAAASVASLTSLASTSSLVAAAAVSSGSLAVTSADPAQPTTPLSPSTDNPDVAARHYQQVPRQAALAPYSVNITGTPTQLYAGIQTFAWTQAKLPPNEYYVVYVASVAGHAGSLGVSAQSSPFFVSQGASTACLVVQPQTHASSKPASTTLAQTTTAAGTIVPQNAASHGVNTGAVAGGVIGGIVILATVTALIIFCVKSRRRRNTARTSDGMYPLPGEGSGSSLDKPVPPTPGSVVNYGNTAPTLPASLPPMQELSQSSARLQKAQRAQASQAYFVNTSNNSPETTLEGTSTSAGKSSILRRASSGDFADAVTVDPRSSITNRSSTHSRQSSTVFSHAQHAQFASPNEYNPRTSKRSTRGSASVTMDEYGQPVASERTSGHALPGGAARPSIVTGGVTPAGPTAQPHITPQRTSPSQTSLSYGSAPEQGSTLVRTPSNGQRRVTRKKAPALPDGTAPVSFYNTNAQGTYSNLSINTAITHTGSARNGVTPSPRGVAGDVMNLNTAKRSSEVLSESPGKGGVFDAFAGARDGPVHYLVPDMPPPPK